MNLPRPLRVHVCIDQELADAPQSGLLRTWVELWRAACHHPEFDITGHTLGSELRVDEWSPNVRVIQHPVPPVSTAVLNRLGLSTPATVGLWPKHRGLAQALDGADVIHSTHTLFSFAMTALRVARRRRVPLTASLQTLVPQHAEIYARGVGGAAFARRVRGALEAQARWYFSHCSRVLLSSEPDHRSLPRSFPERAVVRLSRGIDRDRFHPELRDEAWLDATFGVKQRPVLLYVGKVRPEKNVLTLGHALKALADEGHPFTFLVCGEGDQLAELKALLGERLVACGVQPHEVLRRIYASSGLLVFPSTTESYGQVIMEAMCSGLPAMVSAIGGSAQHIDSDGIEGVLVASDDPRDWSQALRPLLHELPRLRWMGQAARRRAEATYRTWPEIFEHTVGPVWRDAFEAQISHGVELRLLRG